jgi:cysteinyl-tRNA synthetase
MPYINIEILVVTSLLLCVFVTVRSIYFRRLSQQHQEKLTAAQQALQTADEELAELRLVARTFATFKADLAQAELSTKMQHSRLQFNRQYDNLRTPERYHYIHSMAQKGMTADDIAAILTISNQEADQLVALANLSQK